MSETARPTRTDAGAEARDDGDQRHPVGHHDVSVSNEDRSAVSRLLRRGRTTASPAAGAGSHHPECPREKRQALAILRSIQDRSRRFAADVGRVGLPTEQPSRTDASALVQSTNRFVDAQRDNLDVLTRVVKGTASAADRGRVGQLQQQIRSELARQQALISRLRIPECQPGPG